MDLKVDKGMERLNLPSNSYHNAPREIAVFQKLEFGKILLEDNFFKEHTIGEIKNSRVLQVFQFDGDTRFTYIKGNLYSVKSHNPIYNYLDNKRVILTDNSTSWYIFNEMDITNAEVKGFDNYRDKGRLNLQKLLEIEVDNPRVYYGDSTLTIYLVFRENLNGIADRLREIEEEQKSNETLRLQGEQEEERLEACLKNYKALEVMSDTSAEIKGNYLIDKELGLKIVFTKPVVEIFTQDDLLKGYGISSENYLSIDYNNFISKIVKIYTQSTYSNTPVFQRIAEAHKGLFNFKIYSHDLQTGKDTFLKAIKIKNRLKKGKYKLFINNIRIPKSKMKVALTRLYFHFYRNDDIEDIKRKIITRLADYENTLLQVKRYSGTQLELLGGKTITMEHKNRRIAFEIGISNPDNTKLWTVKIADLTLKREYNCVKSAFRHNYGHNSVSTQIANICKTLQCADLEDKLIEIVRQSIEKIKKAEERAKKLFEEFITKNKGRVIPKDDFFIVKGRLKNYKIAVKDKSDVGVWTYPNEGYVCINEKTQKGQFLNVWDKLLQFCLVMLNDGNLREQIHTLR